MRRRLLPWPPPVAVERLRDLEPGRRPAALHQRTALLRYSSATVDVGQNTNIEYRVFLNCDYLSARHADHRPALCRIVRLLRRCSAAMAEWRQGGEKALPRHRSDHDDIERVYGSSATPPGKLRVQIQPAALRPGGNADGSAKPASVEVAIVSA